MSQRVSGYDRQERDAYNTPAWVTEALLQQFQPKGRGKTWESACGDGHMVETLRACGLDVIGTDIVPAKGRESRDFLTSRLLPDVIAIVTNPPFWLGQEFVETALRLIRPVKGSVALLLPVDFDCAHTRRHLFERCPAFALKIVLTKRIVWFKRPGAAPSTNHAWYVWDWRHEGRPVISWGPWERKVRGMF